MWFEGARQLEVTEYCFGENKSLKIWYELEDDDCNIIPSKSTGTEVWPAAHIVCKYLIKWNPVANKRVLELGSGLGLCGLLCPLLEADYTLLTDKDDSVLTLLNTNITSNCIPNSKISYTKLFWGRDLDGFCSRYSAFDVVIASDCIYNDKFTGPLFETAKKCLKANGQLIMGYVARDADLTTLLHKTAENLGFECKQVDLKEIYENDEQIPCSEFVPRESLQLLIFKLK